MYLRARGCAVGDAALFPVSSGGRLRIAAPEPGPAGFRGTGLTPYLDRLYLYLDKRCYGGRCDMKRSLVMGTMDMLILDVLSRGRSYGYHVAQAVIQQSAGYFEVKEGSLYPALHRMEAQGWLASAWERAPEGRRRKYYKLTPAGRRELKRRRAEWARFAAGVQGVLGASYGLA